MDKNVKRTLSESDISSFYKSFKIKSSSHGRLLDFYFVFDINLKKQKKVKILLTNFLRSHLRE